jgi:lipopolysaccharide/colanic/teichoic acid biosynthesis glycosyltransferase
MTTDRRVVNRPEARVRRAVDVIVAVTLGVLGLPVIALVTLAVLIGLGRPLLFRQERPGLHGRLFTVVKFRTMLPAQPGRETDADRTTRLGRFLRASSLDELPQLWNILRGDMSLIGPRPTLPEQVARYGEHERGRLAIRPGVTGWAQVNGRNAISWEARIELDLWYIANRSLALDLKILWLTLLRLVRPEGIVGEGGVNADFVGSPGTSPTAPVDVPTVRPGAPASAVRQPGAAGGEHRPALIDMESAGTGALRLIQTLRADRRPPGAPGRGLPPGGAPPAGRASTRRTRKHLMLKIYSTCPQSKGVPAHRYLEAVADVARWSRQTGRNPGVSARTLRPPQHGCWWLSKRPDRNW